jgi:hypothetical protein
MVMQFPHQGKTGAFCTAMGFFPAENSISVKNKAIVSR